MQQAINDTERHLEEPASTSLRVVHSPRTTEKNDDPIKNGDANTKPVAKPVHRHGRNTHYGRSYFPDGPAGNYQGL